MNEDCFARITGQGSKVAVVRCADYDVSRVYDAVGNGLSLLGGTEQFALPGEKILLKVNLVVAGTPEKAITTHPSVLHAVARHFLNCGARVGYGDSPGFGRPEAVARRAGLTPVQEDLGLILPDFIHGATVSFPCGNLIRQFTVAQGVLDCDGLISLPKLKTHALMRLTGAVKNQFGCIPGLLKNEFHARLSEIDRFARMLVDLTRFLCPRLYIMDAIVAMEGNGPRSGKPRAMNALLFSTDPVALDAVACRLVGLAPELLATNIAGQELGLGVYSRVELLGDPIESLIARDFDLDRAKGPAKSMMPGFLAPFLRNLIVPRPIIDGSRCTQCGTCVDVCPVSPKAVDFRVGTRNAPPSYDYTACIRCYCCQELCPEGAVSKYIPPVGRLLH